MLAEEEGRGKLMKGKIPHGGALKIRTSDHGYCACNCALKLEIGSVHVFSTVFVEHVLLFLKTTLNCFHILCLLVFYLTCFCS